MPKFDDSLYSVDWGKLARWASVERILDEASYRWHLGLISPIYAMYNELLAYRQQVLYFHYITPQVCSIERMLNDRYDQSLRRIEIVETAETRAAELPIKIEGTPMELGLRSEAAPVELPTKGEVGAFTYDFIINVPSAITFNETEARALLAKKIPLGLNYAINRT